MICVDKVTNFIEYDQLLKDKLYNYVCSLSNEKLLPNNYKLFDQFIAYDNSSFEDGFKPNDTCKLAILIGCKEYYINSVYDPTLSMIGLDLYFHSYEFKSGEQECFKYTLNRSSYTNKYETDYGFFLNYLLISSYKENIANKIREYIKQNDIYNKLQADSKSLKNIYQYGTCIDVEV